LRILKGEGIEFDKIFIDKSFPEDNLTTRKPGVGMLTEYFSEQYDLQGSFVIGDRITDVKLAKNLGCKAIFMSDDTKILAENGLIDYCALQTVSWDRVAEFLFAGERQVTIKRTTKETDVFIQLNLDGSGKCNINTGLKFFDHMLDQIGKHSGCDLTIQVKGDLEIDEHHTIEDTALALGEAFGKALGDKRGIERYGFCLPMDDNLCAVALDFGGRPWLVYQAEFKREYVGDFPTEMLLHFFKSFSDAAKMNLNIKAGESYGFLGPNGAGKTTIINTILGFLKPESGRITFEDNSLIGLKTHEIARRGISVVPQERELFPFMTVEENLSIGCSIHTTCTE